MHNISRVLEYMNRTGKLTEVGIGNVHRMHLHLVCLGLWEISAFTLCYLNTSTGLATI